MALRPARALLSALREGQRFLADGAMGSELIRYGVPGEDVLSANVGIPDVVRNIQMRYVQAGSRILSTNTFGLRGEQNPVHYLQAGMEIASRVARENLAEIAVWVSLTPSMAAQESDLLRFLAAHEVHWPKAVLIETCTSLNAALAALNAVRAWQPDLVAVTCHFGANGLLSDGAIPEAVAKALVAAGADIVGANCGETLEAFPQIAERMRSVVSVPLLMQPSAGLPFQEETGHWTYPVTPAAFAEVAEHLVERGVAIVGGCCGTTPEHIVAASARLNAVFSI